MSAEKMPKLPEPLYRSGDWLGAEGAVGENCYDTEQMHDYAKAYAAQEVAKEREACASACEKLAADSEGPLFYIPDGRFAAAECADAIRARTQENLA